MEHGFGFCFLIEYEDEMKKNIGHRWTEADGFFFFLSVFVLFLVVLFYFFFRLSKKEPLFEEIFSKYL